MSLPMAMGAKAIPHSTICVALYLSVVANAAIMDATEIVDANFDCIILSIFLWFLIIMTGIAPIANRAKRSGLIMPFVMPVITISAVNINDTAVAVRDVDLLTNAAIIGSEM